MKRLEYKPHMLAANGRAPIFIEFGQIDARDQYAAGARRIESREQRQQRGFAGTRGADDGQGLAGSHSDADIGENGEGPIGASHCLRDILGFEYDLILHQERS